MIARPGRKVAGLVVLLTAAAGLSAVAWAAGNEHVSIPRQKWSISGFLGHYDQAQLQRGF